MVFNMMRWYEAANTRFSVRNYSMPPSEAEFFLLQDAAASLSARGVRLVLCREPRAFTGLFGRKIKGTDTFLALLSSEAKPQAIGYLGEAFALECAAMNLGTCWLGISYSKAAVLEAAKPREDESLALVISVGRSAEEFVRRPRRTAEDMCELTPAEYEALPEWKRSAIECARLAPSAINAQPWSFNAECQGVEVECISKNHGYGLIDCGIAMLHIELGANASGIKGEWKEGRERALFTPYDE